MSEPYDAANRESFEQRRVRRAAYRHVVMAIDGSLAPHEALVLAEVERIRAAFAAAGAVEDATELQVESVATKGGNDT